MLFSDYIEFWELLDAWSLAVMFCIGLFILIFIHLYRKWIKRLDWNVRAKRPAALSVLPLRCMQKHYAFLFHNEQVASIIDIWLYFIWFFWLYLNHCFWTYFDYFVIFFIVSIKFFSITTTYRIRS